MKPNDLDTPIDPATLCSICYGAGDPGVGVTCPRCGGSGFEPPDEQAAARDLHAISS